MKQAIIGFSLYTLVTEPRHTLYFKMFDLSLRMIEHTFLTIQLLTIVGSIGALTKDLKNYEN
jgi:hypothetical protein